MEKADSTLAQIEKIMQDFKGDKNFKATKDTKLNELGLDSLDTVTLVMDIEEKLGVEIDLNKIAASTVGDIVKIIEAQKK